jgi:hypothetical protein
MKNEENQKGYRDGYRDGFRDGLELYKERNPYPTIPINTGYIQQKCSVCGMSFTDAIGGLKTMGYVCSNPNCPGRISCSVTTQLLNE